jgi:hypothetical protein
MLYTELAIVPINMLAIKEVKVRGGKASLKM